MKKIVIDALGVRLAKSGLSVYSTEVLVRILRQLESVHVEIILHESVLRNDEFVSQINRGNVRIVGSRCNAIGLCRELFFINYFFKNTVDAVYILSSYLPVIAPYDKSIVTIHDIKNFRDKSYIGGLLKHLVIKGLLWHTMRNSSKIITVSNFTKDDILSIGYCAADKLVVAYEGSGIDSSKHENVKPVVNQPYFLAVGVNRPHKNYPNLIEAFTKFNSLHDAGNKFKLIIVGANTETLNVDDFDDVLPLSYVSDEKLASLYKYCYAFVLVSLYEGFCIPLVEAMNFSKPIITSSITATLEVAGDAAILVEPSSKDQIADALLKLSNDDKCVIELSANSKKRSKIFNWNNTADVVSSVLLEAIDY